MANRAVLSQYILVYEMGSFNEYSIIYFVKL